MKRIVLFLATNLAVMTAIGIICTIVFSVLGVERNSIAGLMIFSFIVGFTGAIISLLMSKWMAKRAVGAVVITSPRNEAEAWLVQTITQQAQQLNFKTPEIAIYEADDMNAFATGAFRNSSLVAVSTGLLRKMSRDEVEAVLAHEMSHINNGDMVTMTLLQGLVNTFVVFLSRVVGQIAANALAKNESSARMIYMLTSLVLQVVLMFLANFVVLWFSRRREYAADAGAATLVGAPKMIAALNRLKEPTHENQLPGSVEAFGINGTKNDSLLSTHPSLDNRIAALQQFNLGMRV